MSLLVEKLEKLWGAGVTSLLLVLLVAVLGWPTLAWAQDGSQESSIVELGAPEENFPCGERPLSIVQMQWPSSIVLAHIHGILLHQELGCDVNIVAGDMATSASSMATSGEPAIAPEMWITRIAPIWNSVLETERLQLEAPTFTGEDFEGWFLSSVLGEKLPDLISAAALKENILALREPAASEGASEDESETLASYKKIQFISCPVDWACSIINRNLLAAYGLENELELVEPANRFEMDTLIAQAVSHQQSVVFYYWQPNGVMAQFDFVALDMGAFDADNFKCLAQRECIEPKPSSFANEKAFVVVADWVEESAPLVLQYLRRASLPITEMNEILNWRTDGEIEYEELAAKFVAEREEVWRPWVEGLR